MPNAECRTRKASELGFQHRLGSAWSAPMKHLLCCAIVLGLVMPAPMSAHHSFQAEYDQTKPLTLVGKITKVLQENPHGWIYMDAKNDKGKVVNWALELPAPNTLIRNGFDRNV